MRTLRFFGFNRRQFCDRCDARLDEAFVALCRDCYRIAPESLRPMDIPFNDTGHRICAICAREYSRREMRNVCGPCASKHPDTTHANFGRNREAIFSHCERCGALQVPQPGRGEPRFVSYWTGTPEPLRQPLTCPAPAGAGPLRANADCAHQWILVQSLPPEADEPLEHDAARLFLSEEQMQALRESTRSGSSTFWCCTCGSVKHARQTADC